VNEFREVTNKQLKELNENGNKQLSKIRKTMQDMKEECNKNSENESN
jgi:CHASE3 domain sensor protein